MLAVGYSMRSPLLRRLGKSTTIRYFPNSLCVRTSEAEFDGARQWLQRFDESVIPRTVGDVSYSRSSGPGGQNVNK